MARCQWFCVFSWFGCHRDLHKVDRRQRQMCKSDSYHTAGKNTLINRPVSPSTESSFSQDTATHTGISTISTTATSVSCDDPAIWYYKEVLGKDGILDIIDPVTSERNTLLFDSCSSPSNAALTVIQLDSGSAVTIDGGSWYNGFQLSDKTVS